MACERRAGGQVILLGGILLVLAFVMFSIQLALLANLGQQTGRETQTPLLDDYFVLRRSFQTYLTEELRNAQGQVVCPADLEEYKGRVRTQLDYLSLLEANRGQFLEGTILSAALGINSVEVRVRLSLGGGFTVLTDEVKYTVTCT